MPNLELELAQALDHHRASRLIQAEKLYQRVLAAEPRHPKALYSLGLLALQTQRNDLAADLLKRAVNVEPNNIASHFNLGEAYRRLGRRREAKESLGQVLSRNPEFAEGFYNLALVLRDNGEIENAVKCFDRAVELKSDVLLFQQALADTLGQLGDLARAIGHQTCAWLLSGCDASKLEALVSMISLFGRADAADELRRCYSQSAGTAGATASTKAEAAHRQALELDKLGKLQDARFLHEFAAYAQPDAFIHQIALAGSLLSLGALERAVSHFYCALALKPRSVETLVSLSAVLKELGRLEGAAAAGQRALGIDPKSALAHASLAAARADQQRNEEAIASAQRAIELDPAVGLAHFELGFARLGRGEVEAAIDCFRRTIALNPAHHISHSNIVLLLSYVPGVSAEVIGAEARAWAEHRAEPLAQEITPHTNDRTPDRRLRIGYVSPDFRNHSVASFMLPLLEHHDRSAFEIICYASVRHPDAITERLGAHADGWRNIAGAGDPAVAELIRNDGIDVLVDLAMHTAGGRLRLFARKPAPVQVCWLAYVGTTGLSTMDYRITDPYLDPPELDPGWCSEKPLILPDSFWCYGPIEPAPDVSPLPALSSGQVTFGSLHSFHKIRPGVLELWARVLRSAEGSRLALYAPADAQDAILKVLEQERINASRIEFLSWKPRHEYLATYHRIDVSLDTVPFNGATTSLDAFYMGVPVVTLLGQTPVGRSGLSIATNLGLPELVATSEDDYVKATVNLIGDLARLGELRAGLRSRMERSPLMDAPRFVRNLEAAFRNAWTTWCQSDAGSSPEHGKNGEGSRTL